MKRREYTGLLKAVWPYGLLLGAILIAFKLFEYSYFSRRITLDLYLGVVSIVFLAVGLIIGLKGAGRQNKSAAPQDDMPAQPAASTPDLPALPPELDLSRRELEVLSYLVQGHTNRQIAEALFVSLNTVKTHVSNIYRKLDVERRAQAVARAKALEIGE